jgi:hypothetical protein
LIRHWKQTIDVVTCSFFVHVFALKITITTVYIEKQKEICTQLTNLYICQLDYGLILSIFYVPACYIHGIRFIFQNNYRLSSLNQRQGVSMRLFLTRRWISHTPRIQRKIFKYKWKRILSKRKSCNSVQKIDINCQRKIWLID